MIVNPWRKPKSPWSTIASAILLLLLVVFVQAMFTAHLQKQRQQKAQMEVKAAAEEYARLSDKTLQLYAGEAEHNLDELMAAWTEGDEFRTQKASIDFWSNLDNIGRAAFNMPSISNESETKLVALLDCENARRYFSTQNVRTYFAENAAVAQIRGRITDAPPHFQRLWAIIEGRLAEPPVPMPAVTRKR